MDYLHKKEIYTAMKEIQLVEHKEKSKFTTMSIIIFPA